MLADLLPISETRQPSDEQALIAAVVDCHASRTALYPIGGGTSLDYGLPARREGIGLSLSGLNRVIDFPARDMTITVEAGVAMKTLAETLAAERLRLPIDVPAAGKATIGAVVATNQNGPRRYGLGSVRDYVIGVSAVDGSGAPFKGGGRVVKNVAGYDFCKLLTGSLGTLGVITQLTVKLKPLVEKSVFVVASISDLTAAEQALAALIHSQTTPMAIELLSGPAWKSYSLLGESVSDSFALAVGLEGTEQEVDWMQKQLADEWREQGLSQQKTIIADDAQRLWRTLAEFSIEGESPLTIQASVAPSGTTKFMAAARRIDPNCSIQAHAGNGLVVVRFAEFPAEGLSRALVGDLQPVARAAGGSVVILSNPGGMEMTRRSVWGGLDAPIDIMTAVKQKFDPKNILNPGRFVYP